MPGEGKGEGRGFIDVIAAAGERLGSGRRERMHPLRYDFK
jgi:hypothetical protein